MACVECEFRVSWLVGVVLGWLSLGRHSWGVGGVFVSVVGIIVLWVVGCLFCFDDLVFMLLLGSCCFMVLFYVCWFLCCLVLYFC